MNKNRLYNPDVLLMLANLSSDEVFTPPELANKMLDLLPKSIWNDKNAKFLDPVSKSGVFLREITKRLLKGLANEIPDLQERINHILTKQVYGLAITELTSLISRRTLYCSKNANSKYSITTEFDRENGNIFYYEIDHTWKNGRCIFCGASEKQYKRINDLESHAYLLIHNKMPKEVARMKFDVIIGNPPYQLETSGAQAQAIPIYNKFIEQSIKLNPRYLVMITPSRWFTGGFGLRDFREKMLRDKRLKEIYDFYDASECFPDVEIKGGVNYFLWDREYNGDCTIHNIENGKIVSKMKRPLLEPNLDVFIRYNDAVTILKKVLKYNENSLTTMISSQKPFGLPTNFNDYLENNKEGAIKIYANKKVGYVDLDKITKNQELLKYWKVLAPKAIGSGNISEDWVKPILSEPNSACTETYVVLGAFSKLEYAENFISYTQTKFFHFLLGLKKNTQDALRKAYEFIPVQDFSRKWNDEELFKKYNFTEKEIEYIKTVVRKEVGEEID